MVIGMSYIAYIAFDGDGKCTMKILTLPWKKGEEIDIYRPDKSMSAMQVSKKQRLGGGEDVDVSIPTKTLQDISLGMLSSADK